MKTGVMMLKIIMMLLCITGINYILKYIQIENINNICVLLYICSNKCIFAEHKTYLKKK